MVSEEDNNQKIYEKWIIAFLNNGKNRNKIIYREFLASEFYEAFEIVSDYIEKMHLTLLWFKEKRECGGFLNKPISPLESICVYCNRIFNDNEPIPCKAINCKMTFCSRYCLSNHLNYKHREISM